MSSNVKIGEPYKISRFTTLTGVDAGDDYELTFDPPNILFLDGGVEIQVEAYDTETPVLIVRHWADWDNPSRFKMRRQRKKSPSQTIDGENA